MTKTTLCQTFQEFGDLLQQASFLLNLNNQMCNIPIGASDDIADMYISQFNV